MLWSSALEAACGPPARHDRRGDGAGGDLHRRLVEKPPLARLTAEKHVLDHVEVVAEREILVHGADAALI